MKVTEIEEYYGKEVANWVRSQIADGTFKPPAVNIRLENPKCERQFLKINDAIGYFDPDGYPMIKLPEHLRAFDFVRVEIEEVKILKKSEEGLDE